MTGSLHVVNWPWRLHETPKRQIVFAPDFRILLQELGLAFVWWLGAVGFLGIDHELRAVRENRGFTEAEVEQLKRGYDHQLAVERSARGPEAAEKLRRELYGFVEERAAQQAALIRQQQENQAIWHQLLAGASGVLIAMGILGPLSLLWRRTSIRRDGGDLIFTHRRRLGARREARVGVESLERPNIAIKEVHHRTRYGRVRVGYLVMLTLSDGLRTVVLFPTKTSKRIYNNVEALLREMRTL